MLGCVCCKRSSELRVFVGLCYCVCYKRSSQLSPIKICIHCQSLRSEQPIRDCILIWSIKVYEFKFWFISVCRLTLVHLALSARRRDIRSSRPLTRLWPESRCQRRVWRACTSPAQTPCPMSQKHSTHTSSYKPTNTKYYIYSLSFHYHFYVGQTHITHF